LNCAVAYFAAEAAPARRLARTLGAPARPIRTHRFPDGEILPRATLPVPDTTFLYRSLDRPNAKLIELLLAADALRRAGARRLVLIAPYVCYLRQDAVFQPGEPLSRDVVGPLIGRAFDGVVTVQAHLHRTADLSATLGAPAVNLWAVETLAAALPRYSTSPLVVAPDAEAGPWAQAWAKRLRGEAALLKKTRLGDRRVEIDFAGVSAQGRPVVIIDDVASSGETLAAATEGARRAGAASIDIAIVHALMSETAARSLREAGARVIVSTDSVRHSTNAAHLAPELAHAALSMAKAL
jgi:ribose-phosphate pyrophosphokinase